jgi:hypothetical protein
MLLLVVLLWAEPEVGDDTTLVAPQIRYEASMSFNFWSYRCFLLWPTVGARGKVMSVF